MARDGWFDNSGIDLFENSLEARSKEIQEYIRDGKITKEEIKRQWDIVQNKLKALEPKLSDTTHAELTQILIDIELAVRMEDFNAGTGVFAPRSDN